jgi:hypothetical protein
VTTTNLPLYRILVKSGATEAEAEAAAVSFDPLELATKRDLAEFESRLAWKIGGLIVGAMVSMTGIFALIVGWLTRQP